MRGRLPLLFFIGLFCALDSKAQQDPQFSQYMFNSLYYNPAFAGVDGLTRITALHRTQWLGYSTSFDGNGGNPNTEILNISRPIDKIKGGVGFELFNDHLGPQNNFKASLTYAFHFKLRESVISIGLRGGIFAQTINYDQYRPVQPDDPLLAGKAGKETQMKPDLAAGIWYNAPKYYLGVSMNHLIRSKFDFGISGGNNALEKNLTFTAGYIYKAGYNLTLTPSVLVKTNLSSSYSFDVGVIGTYNQKMWLGASFRQSEAAVIMLGYSFLKENALKVGYSFDYIIKDKEAKQPTSHELLVTYLLPVSNEKRKIIKTPRFNH